MPSTQQELNKCWRLLCALILVFLPALSGLKDNLYPGQPSFQAKVLSGKSGLHTWRVVFSWKQWFLPPTPFSLLPSGCFNSRCKKPAYGRRQVATLVGSLFCFYVFVFIAIFQEQLKETRDPNDSMHVPSFEAVQSLFHQLGGLLGKKMVSCPPEINEVKEVITKQWGKGVSAPAGVDTFSSSPEQSC